MPDGGIVAWDEQHDVSPMSPARNWPVMPVECTGFHLVPVGFFDRNPSLDVPPSPAAPCHHRQHRPTPGP